MIMKKNEYIAKNVAFLDEIRKKEGVKELRGGVLYEVVSSGDGSGVVKPRSIVTCHYKGSLINGKVFDNSYERNCPEAFHISDIGFCK